MRSQKSLKSGMNEVCLKDQLFGGGLEWARVCRTRTYLECMWKRRKLKMNECDKCRKCM